MSKFKAIPCKISRGGFSGERVFEIAIGETNHSGVGSRLHMWKLNGDMIEEGEPPLGEKMDGIVAARVLSVEEGVATVSIPDGEVITILAEELLDRPAVNQHVSIG